MRLEVLLENTLIGWLEHDSTTNRFAFDYASSWLDDRERFALSPQLPLNPREGTSPEWHSAAVRQFFDNLLPEGQALDAAASAHHVSKSNLVGLLVALGQETAGALRIRRDGVEEGREANRMRPLSLEELSERIRSRPNIPFSVWDGRVRLSIAGYQDKIALYRKDDTWFFVDGDGDGLASTHILKPEPVSSALAGLTTNEFFCMRLAREVGLPVANVDLIHVPEPVLVIERFDRLVRADRVQRIHLIDGCQALGLSSAFKYERPYGDSRDVRDIRDGASLPRLFRLLDDSANPAAQRLQLLRWTLFQILVGNTDAHAKNLSFFSGQAGLQLAPAYDLLCGHLYDSATIDTSYAMAIGDAFQEEDLSPYEWAHFATLTQLPFRLVSRELKNLATNVRRVLPRVQEAALQAGAAPEPLCALVALITYECERQLPMASELLEVDASLF